MLTFMPLMFVPKSVGEVLGLGEGLASAEGHSLLLEGTITEGYTGYEKPFCKGTVRIEERTTESEEGLGLFQISNIDRDLHFNCVLFVTRDEFGSIRKVLTEGENPSVKIEGASNLSAAELANTRPPETVKVVSASISSRNLSPKPNKSVG